MRKVKINQNIFQCKLFSVIVRHFGKKVNLFDFSSFYQIFIRINFYLLTFTLNTTINPSLLFSSIVHFLHLIELRLILVPFLDFLNPDLKQRTNWFMVRQIDINILVNDLIDHIINFFLVKDTVAPGR